ncbi:MAG: type II toxin-antitoxin system HicB family antitoxin [Dehalococcoidia bacterium]|nr:type II toxin-antitoxin system HicB family antitoxin [Dehalococcoidia bacterium]
MKFLIQLTAGEDGKIVTACPTLPGCLTQGGTKAEALLNIQEAIGAYLTSMRKHGETVPIRDVAEVDVPA